jgi:hypothetical protein
MLFQAAPARRDAQHGHRRRPYRVEHTGSFSTSEVKRRKARLVLGWRTAWELVRVLSAFVFVCPVSFARARRAQALLASAPCISKGPLCELQFRRQRKTSPRIQSVSLAWSVIPVLYSRSAGLVQSSRSVESGRSVQSVQSSRSAGPVQSGPVWSASLVQSVSWSGPVQSVGRVWSVSPVSAVQSISWSSPVWSSLVGQCTLGPLDPWTLGRSGGVLGDFGVWRYSLRYTF